MQRVTRWQYERVVRDALGASLALSDQFPRTETVAAPYSTWPEANAIAVASVKGIADSAETLADAITDGLPACTGGDETTCARSELSTLAQKLFRRSATAAELEPLVALFTSMRTEFTYKEAVALSVAALLQHPQVLYVVEQQTGALSHDQLAQRLALLYLGGLPDDELNAASLSTPAEREAQANRMIATPKGREAITQFVFEWLMLEGFAADQYSPAIQSALEGELQRLVDDALKQPNGFSTLLTSSRGFVNATLETFYGLPTEAKGTDGWRAVEFPAGSRVGILTHPLLMARTAHGITPSLILRGKFVRTLLLCGELSSPPAGATAMQPDAGVASTPRESSAARMQIAQCKTCHQLMDPIGYAFLGVDGAGKPIAGVDVSGDVLAGGDVSGSFTGVAELGSKLAASDDTARCFAKQWLRYSIGRKETAADACSVKALGDRFISSGRSLPTLFTGLAGLDAFGSRAAKVNP